MIIASNLAPLKENIVVTQVQRTRQDLISTSPRRAFRPSVLFPFDTRRTIRWSVEAAGWMLAAACLILAWFVLLSVAYQPFTHPIH